MSNPTPPLIPTQNQPVKPRPRADTAPLYKIYRAKRIGAQMQFYEDRIAENVQNSSFTFLWATVIMGLSSFLALISTTSKELHGWAGVAAILPALAALLSAFRQLYGWDRQANIYRDAHLNLERVLLDEPDDDQMTQVDMNQIFPNMLNATEEVLAGESSQWGQFVVDKDKAAGVAGDEALNKLASTLKLSEDQVTGIQNIINAGKISSP